MGQTWHLKGSKDDEFDCNGFPVFTFAYTNAIIAYS